MKKLNIICVLFAIFTFTCKETSLENELTTNLKNNVSDTVFIGVLSNFIKLNDKSRESKFIQVFVNYEQNISRYIFFTTKSMYDLKTQPPYDYFYFKNHIVLIYTGLDYIFKIKRNFPENFDDFINVEELFKDIDSNKHFISKFSSENISLGINSWELRVFHSFKDSTYLNINYEGKFVWNGSRVKLDTLAKFIPPIIYEDKIDDK